MTDKLTPPTLLTWEELPDLCVYYRHMDDGTFAGPYPKTKGAWGGEGEFILAPVKPKRKEIWEGHVDDEVAYASMAHHKISNISVAAYLLDRHGLYDDEIRAKLEAAYYG